MKAGTWRRIAGAGLLTTAGALVLATWPTAAQADSPVRTGWWNTASGGGQSAPQPTTADGGLHIAVAPGQILAYGAVLYDMPQDATATLELKVGGQGTPVLVACPTKDVSWKEGGNQPASDEPTYDCSAHSYTGALSSDGSTVTFLLDGSAETTPGELSLAILPYMTHDAPGGVGTELPVDSTAPFSVDIPKPDASSLVITSTLPTTSDSGSTGSTSQGSQPATGSSGAAATSTGGSTGGAPVPANLTAGPPPATTTSVDNTPPQVAPAGNAQQPGALTNAAAGMPKIDNTAHNAALALLILVAMAVVASGTTSVQRAPRLLGGAGRHAAGAAAGAAPAVVAMPAMTRGLGRFARERVAPPRPLV